MKLQSLLGKKFSELKVLKRDNSEHFNGKAKWICKCSCGKIKSIWASNLTQGTTKSCGHILKQKYKNMRKKKGERGFYIIREGYKRGAKYRNIYFNLKDSDLLKLFKDNCHYCGINPKQVSYDKSTSLTKAAKNNGKFIYNGIDRINNKKGYIKNNVVSCCKDCNLAKHVKTLKEFENWINRILKYRKKYDQ